MCVYIQSSTVCIAYTNIPKCPVAMMEQCYEWASLSHSSYLLLFVALRAISMHGEQLQSIGDPSYTCVWMSFCCEMGSGWLWSTRVYFRLLRLWAGGATAVVTGGVPAFLFLNDMGIGNLRQQKIDMSRTPGSQFSQCSEAWNDDTLPDLSLHW